MKVIGIVGSRRRDANADLREVRRAVDAFYDEGDQFVSGGCPKGGDRFAEIIARDLGTTITIHHANWKKYGKVAGFLRNTRIAQDAEILIACVADDRTGGTEDTVRKFEQRGLKAVLV